MAGWEFTGTLCGAKDTDHGCLWEYPNLLKLPQATMAGDGTVAFNYENQEVGVASEATRDHVLLFGTLFDNPFSRSQERMRAPPSCDLTQFEEL